jgi:hypothetical protein
MIFFLPPGRPKAKSAPSGGSKPKARRGGLSPAGPPQGKKRPLGGQQAEGAAWPPDSALKELAVGKVYNRSRLKFPIPAGWRGSRVARPSYVAAP